MSQLKNNSEENSELRRFLDSLSDWVWEMDVNGIHTYSNKAVESILGYKSEALIGRHVSMFWPPENATSHKIEKFNTELKDGASWYHFRARFRHKNGQLKILESSGEPLFNEAGGLIGFRGVDRDISMTLENEKELEDSRERFKALSEKLAWENNFKALLLDIINHDIMNPVNVIYGYADILKDQLPENKMIQSISISSRRLIEVIENARALTQITMGESLTLEPISLFRIIDVALAEYRRHADQKGIKLEVSIPEDMSIRANPVIVEVFKNYLNNVMKYAGESERVKIQAQSVDGFITVEIKDEGETLPEEVRQSIFQRGVQLNNTEGSGMGLAIVQRIAEAHGALVGVRPRPRGGNSFFIQFPEYISSSKRKQAE